MDNVLLMLITNYLVAFTPALIGILLFEIIWNIIRRAFRRGV